MKFIKLGRILAGVILVFCLTVMPIPARAEEGGTTPGQFQVGSAAPTVSSVQLYTAGDDITNDMTPQVKYNVKVNVSDANTLDDLTTVTVTIFYDALGGYSDDEVSGTADNKTRAILTWTNGGSWSIEPLAGTGTSWVLESGNCSKPDLSAFSGTFEFHFRPGKVATETITPAKWHIYAEAVDNSASTANNTDVDNNMMWFGEITVPGSTIDWDSMVPGEGFGESTNQTDISVTYIANGAYDEQVATSANWTSASDNATLDELGNCTNTNEFALKADDTTTLGNAELVTASPDYVAIDNTGTQTTEDGDTVTTNTLWLKLSSVFLARTYSGSIYFQITNGD